MRRWRRYGRRVPRQGHVLDISPDDRTLAVSIDEHFEQGDFWFVQIDGGGKSRLTALNISVVSDRVFVNSYAPYAVTSDGRIINTQPVGYILPTIHLVTNGSDILGR